MTIVLIDACVCSTTYQKAKRNFPESITSATTSYPIHLRAQPVHRSRGNKQPIAAVKPTTRAHSPSATFRPPRWRLVPPELARADASFFARVGSVATIGRGDRFPRMTVAPGAPAPNDLRFASLNFV